MEPTALKSSDLPASQGNGPGTDKKAGAQKDWMTGARAHGQFAQGLVWHLHSESAQPSQLSACEALSVVVLLNSKLQDML